MSAAQAQAPAATQPAATQPEGAAAPPGAGSTGGEHIPFVHGPRRRRPLASKRQKVVAGAIVLAALSLLVFKGLTDAMNYYLTANQAVAQRAFLANKDFRIQGTVLDDVRQAGTALDFTIASHGVEVHVVSTGSPSALFKPGIPVVLAGHWQGDIFSSYQIMVQHGSNYVEAPAHHATAAGRPGAANPAGARRGS